MLLDLLLACLHHLVFVLLLCVLVCEMTTVREGIRAPVIKNVLRIDAIYGALALLTIVIGVCRVVWGAKGADYYLHNLWFWLKMAAFLGVGLCSVPPTLIFQRWRKTLAKNSDFVPSQEDIVKVRRWLRRQFSLFIYIPIFAAIMARYSGYIAF
jgi:putative membrane protein